MAYTQQQKLRKMQARNKGSNKRIGIALRRLAAMLDQKGPEELSREEILALQGLRALLNQRLYANSCTKAVQLVMIGNYQIVNGKYRMTLNPKDL